MRIGVIGLGAMGGAFARNLLKAGHRVIAWNRSPAPLEAFRREGGEAAGTIEAAFDTDLTLSMLADDQAYRELFLASGLLKRLPPGSVHAVMATVSIALAKEFSAAHAAHGLGYLAAPVLGNSAAARDAKVHVLMAGDQAALERARPAFEAIGQSIRNFGVEPYRANVAKIIANFVLGSAIETLGEALALSRAYDLTADEIVDMLTNTAFAAPAYKIYGEAMAKERYEPPAFKLGLGAKDIRLALAAARSVSVALPVAEVVAESAEKAMANGDADKDFSALAKVAGRRAGV